MIDVTVQQNRQFGCIVGRQVRKRIYICRVFATMRPANGHFRDAHGSGQAPTVTVPGRRRRLTFRVVGCWLTLSTGLCGIPLVMYPLSDPALYLSEIARHWAREPQLGMPETEILDRLLSAFWLGDLVAVLNPGVPRDPFEQRKKTLEMIAGAHDHSGLVFVPPGQEPPPDLVELPDGSSFVDLAVRVAWPPPAGSDPAELATRAFAELAHVSLADYAPDVQPALGVLTVERADFEEFCRLRSYQLPAFWFGKPSKSRAITTAAAVTKCRRWLEARVTSGSKPFSKPAIRAQAQQEFPPLSAPAFNQIWAEVVPPEWRRAGAPKKRR